VEITDRYFCDESERVIYLERIEHYRERHRCMVYACVLMSNHVHLLIETGAVGLSKIMQGIQFSYTQHWQSRPKCWRGCLTRPCRSENPLDKL
jgi:REP element-mobilizing transposase RayT